MPKIILLKYFELCLQLLTALVGVYFAVRRKDRLTLFLAVLLVTSAGVEVIGEYGVLNKRPLFLPYYIFSFIQFNIIMIIYNIIGERKMVSSILTLFFFVFWCIVYFNESLFPYLIILGSFNTSIYILLYLRRLLVSDEILNYKKLLPFWISVAFLVFYLPSIPFFSMLNYMQTRGLFFILHILIVLMDLIIIYGLICSEKEGKY